MNFKVPGFEKCCFFVPLRYGILIFGYLNLKKTYLLRIYYYYGIIATAAAFISFFIMSHDDKRDVEYLYVYTFVAVAGLVYNVCLLLLIRAEMQKLYLQHEEFYKNKNSDVMLELSNP